MMLAQPTQRGVAQLVLLCSINLSLPVADFGLMLNLQVTN
jgi:hypothetical protein